MSFGEIDLPKIIKNIGTLGWSIISGGEEGDYKNWNNIKNFVSEQTQDSPFKENSSKILGKALIMMFIAPKKTLNGIEKRWTEKAITKDYKSRTWDPETITDIVLLEMDPDTVRVKRQKSKKK